ncbi:unnamed protein product [Effrenium voratum]|nr:unnamed protein product [Effrenium voratum]
MAVRRVISEAAPRSCGKRSIALNGSQKFQEPLDDGVAALSSARLLQRSLPHAEVTVVHSAPCLRTARGAKRQILEQGFQNSILVDKHGREALGLLKLLRLQDEVVSANIEASARRHLLHRGKVQLVPGPLHILTYGWAFLAEPVWPRAREEDESVASFVSRRGSTAVAQRLADPICRGQLAGDATELSVRTCFPRLWHNEQRFGSVFLGAALDSVLSYRQRSWMALDLLDRILQLARCQRRRVLRAAREDDHAVAVRNWLQKLVIGMNFCPWAKSVNEDNGIKVVTSLATTEDEVLSDLKREAAWLPVGEAKTKPTTTLVVCPYVAPWQDFAPFGDFFGEKLENGVLLEDEFGVKLVGFHPQYEEEPLHGSVLDVGDVLTLPLKDEPEPVTVLDPAPDADGEAFLVRRQDGGEEMISYKRLTELLAEDDSGLPPETAEEEEDELESVEGIAQRAPRPTIHLLRLCDLSNALAEGVEVGDRVLEQNALSAQELGYAGWQRLMSQCEPAAKAWGSYSFRDGMSSLLRTLEEQLLIPGPGTVPAEIRRNSAAERLEAPGDARARVWLRDGSCVEADCVIAAVPPADLSQVLRQSGFEQDRMCQLLTSVRHKSVGVVNLCYEKDVLKERRWRGAGYFVGSLEQEGLGP